VIQLTRLTAATLWRLSGIERNPEATPWEHDVESIILGALGRSHLREPTSALFAADSSGRVIGAALHYSHELLPGVQYLAGVMINHRTRRHGHGRSLMTAAIGDARMRSGRAYVAWAVHPQNAAMLQLSQSLAAEIGIDDETGYVQFVDP
jgi:L-amino acid N-acyltransferase YncA